MADLIYFICVFIEAHSTPPLKVFLHYQNTIARRPLLRGPGARAMLFANSHFMACCAMPHVSLSPSPSALALADLCLSWEYLKYHSRACRQYQRDLLSGMRTHSQLAQDRELVHAHAVRMQPNLMRQRSQERAGVFCWQAEGLARAQELHVIRDRLARLQARALAQASDRHAMLEKRARNTLPWKKHERPR